jgi:two-component system, OmpR family, response regulator QseB
MIVKRGGEPVRLSRREFSILHALMDRPGQILSKAQLEDKLYGKLGTATIETVRGICYRLAEDGA